MKRYITFLFMVILFIFPFKVKAECSNSEKIRLQKLASNVSFSYRSKEEGHNVSFEIIVSNLNKELYIVEKGTGSIYYGNNEDFIIPNLKPGSNFRFDFYSADRECMTSSAFTSYVSLPSYNPYYNNRVCEGAEEYKLCQKWLKHTMTYKEFADSVIAYKNSKLPKKEEEIIIPVKKDFDWYNIIDFWTRYYIYILLVIILFGGIILYRANKKSNL